MKRIYNSRTLIWVVLCLFSAALFIVMMWPSRSDANLGSEPINPQLEKLLEPASAELSAEDQSTVMPPASQAGESGKAAQAESSQGESGKINVNTSGLSELDKLPGIGPSKAQAIIDYRNEHGPFQSPEDMLQIKGIGEKTLAKFKDMLEF